VDELRIGRALRALRLRRRLRQIDVASKAGISRSQYGRIERGELRGVPLDDIAAACAALGADLDVRVRWHGEGLDRLLDAAHAELVNAIVGLLHRGGWTTAVEVTFNHFGERGAVDVLGWKAEFQALLIVEVKSVVPDSQAMLSAHDRKFRLGGVIAAERGWHPSVVGKLLVVGDGSTSRRRVRGLEAMFASAYPDRARVVEAWLARPLRPLAGLIFVSHAHRDGTRQATGVRRVARGSVRG
jgi:transcriptional regulator with XRE-family HTH domain